MSSAYHILIMAIQYMSDDEPEVMLIKGYDFYRRWHQTISRWLISVDREPTQEQTVGYESGSARVSCNMTATAAWERCNETLPSSQMPGQATATQKQLAYMCWWHISIETS